MDMNLESCPSCGGMLFFASGSFPASSAHHGDKVETECPLCEEQIVIGYVSEYRWVTSPAPEPGGASTSSGGAGNGGSAANANRSNTLNPNNPAHRAAHDNRANQLNPNSRAYRSSRGCRRAAV